MIYTIPAPHSAQIRTIDATAFDMPERVGLEGVWHVSEPDRGITLTGHVPGIVDTDLLAAGKIPDPYYRDNDDAIQWVGQVPWTYSRTFTLKASFIRHRHIVLHCDGLDTLAHVVVNGKPVADTDNMFRTWEFDVRPLVHAGVNRIDIRFDPVEPYLNARQNQTAFPGKPMSGWGYLRKAPFQQGWDFAPKLLTCGIWRPIGLIGWDDARLSDIGVTQVHHASGDVDLDVEVEASTDKSIVAETTVSFHGRPVAQSITPVVDGKATSKLTILHPQLWWPEGMGPQNLYNVGVVLRESEETSPQPSPWKGEGAREGSSHFGRGLDSADRTIGLRTVTWIPKTDRHPLTLAVNGRPFFAKGTNWVPCDALISRATPARERQFVDDAVDAHMNLVRLWGGGYYEDDALFDECDKKGLMLWSEFKFADAAYPVFDPAWLASVRSEFEENVRRLRNHPCIAVWSGNNECIGFVADQTDASHMSRADYDLLFHQTLAGICLRLAPGSPYTPGSPEAGDDHDWSVWHGGAAFESYLDVHGFMSEFGYQSLPQPKTVETYTNAADRASILTPIMRYHQRNWGSGNQIILNGFNRYYRKPKDFESTLWLSQIQQADGVLAGVEHWRRDWPNSTGSLAWQYDDCWPTASWAMVDYDGRPKALWYRLKHAYAPVTLSGQVDRNTDDAELWIVNDLARSLSGRLDWRLVRMDGSATEKGSSPVSIPAGESSIRALMLRFDQTVGTSKGEYLLFADLSVTGQPVSRTVLVFTKPKYLNLIAPRIKVAVAPYGDSSYRVTLAAAHPALRAWLDIDGLDARYSDNFVDLRPGQPVDIVVRPSVKVSAAAFAKALRVRSLFDTYLPGDDVSNIVKAGTDGTIVATADQADIEGNTAFVEIPDPARTGPNAPHNIANWSDVHDYLEWTVQGAKPGTYDVTANVGCPPEEAGSTFTIDVDGSTVTGTMPPTADWWTYKTIDLGTVTITKSGTIMIVLTPTSKPSTHVGNLRWVKLWAVQ